jgi:hypothetical protein
MLVEQCADVLLEAFLLVVQLDCSEVHHGASSLSSLGSR